MENRKEECMDRINRMEVCTIFKEGSRMPEVKIQNTKISIETEFADCVIIRKMIKSMYYRNAQPGNG